MLDSFMQKTPLIIYIHKSNMSNNNILLTVHHKIYTIVKRIICTLFIQFIMKYQLLYVPSATSSSSGDLAYKTIGILREYYVFWLHQVRSGSATLVQPTDLIRNIPIFVYAAPPEDEQVVLGTQYTENKECISLVLLH
jgi:hypothetical protein